MKNLFDPIAIADVQKLTRAIDHADRKRIMEYLEKNPGATGNDIHKHMKGERNYLTTHLSILRDVGIVSGEKDKTRVHFSLNREYMNSINAQFKSISVTLKESQ